MSYALVGSVGALDTTTTTPAWGSGSSQTAGNLLIAFGWGSSGGAVTTPSSWSLAESEGTETAADSVYLFYKIAAGGDAAPTLAGSARCQLAEFSGNASSSPLDQVQKGGNTGTSTALTLTMPSADAAAGELVIFMLGGVSGHSTGTIDLTSQNNGLSMTTEGNADAGWAWGTTTSNGAADSVAGYIAHTGSGSQSQNGVLVSFKLGASSNGQFFFLFAA